VHRPHAARLMTFSKAIGNVAVPPPASAQRNEVIFAINDLTGRRSVPRFDSAVGAPSCAHGSGRSAPRPTVGQAARSALEAGRKPQRRDGSNTQFLLSSSPVHETTPRPVLLLAQDSVRVEAGRAPRRGVRAQRCRRDETGCHKRHERQIEPRHAQRESDHPAG
jgi:hypothetical protein